MSVLKQTISIVSVCSLAVVLAGCSVGMAPSGGSNDEVKSAYDKMPLEEKVKLINSQGIPAEKKKQLIDEAYKKAGQTPPADGGAAPSSGPPPGMGMPSQGGR